MRSFALVAASALLLAGCLGSSEEASDEDLTPTTNATRTDGLAVGPSTAVTLPPAGNSETSTTFHPYTFSGGKARPAVVKTFEGAFDADDCNVPTAVGGATGLVNGWQFFDLVENFQKGDVALLHAALAWNNTDASWGDLHLIVNTPTGGTFSTDSTASERGPLVLEWVEQVYWRGDEGDQASVGVVCFYGGNVDPIHYQIVVTLEYAENVLPSNTPAVVPVPEDVRNLLVTGVPTGDGPVTGHYRLFGPDDQLIGEYALNSDEIADVVPLAKAGDYVVIVDHTEGGFVALGADVPLADNALVPLDVGFTAVPLLDQPVPGPVGETIAFTLPRVPLGLFAWADASGDHTVAYGKDLRLSLEGPRGPVMTFVMDGFVSMNGPTYTWVPIPGVGWAFDYDHHALAVGDHVASIDGPLFQGRVQFFWGTYLRPGEEGGALPDVSGASSSGSLVRLL